ncbi:MAG: LysM peptidoglycan-binding domain-containing protein [Lachnospiraceae bacterium]|nr:LysM peptidoglycan-binding domain-containing protein [Lachnospiraceae bacterium]
MSIKGIDVSSYQGTIDWAKAAAAGVQFAILKVIRRDRNPDKQFENNWAGATEACVPIQGVYNYSYAATVAKAKRDAQAVISVLGGRTPMVWLDVENDVQKNIGQMLTEIINAYGAIITAAGCRFGVYTGLGFYNSYIRPYADQITYPFWIAHYPGSVSMSISADPADDRRPEIVHDLYGWQYSSKGSVSGISGNVDLDELYVAVETEEAASAAVSYTVRSGDTLLAIAKKYGTTVSAIMALNSSIMDANRIYVNQVIRVK